VVGGIVTSATLVNSGSNYTVGQTLTTSNTNLGGTGSGLIVTVTSVDSSLFRIQNAVANSALSSDISLFHYNSSTLADEGLGFIKWETTDASSGVAGIQAKFGAYSSSILGGAYFTFATKSGNTTTERVRIDNIGALGIGTSSLTGYNLRVSKTITGATTSYGIQNDGVIQSGVTTTATYNSTNASTIDAAFTCGTIYHYLAVQGTFGASSTVTNQFGFIVGSSLIGATNNFGFRGDIPSGTNRWNLYMAGTAANYMAGSLGIGQTSLTGYTLRISKNITGATTSYAIRQDGIVQSDVTSGASNFASFTNTAAASFTLGSYTHFSAQQGTIGAGSSITNQYGFLVTSNMVGATNNYAFYGNIGAGSNAWNIYMGGTAANYMAGVLNIGSTTLAGYTLDVNGTGRYVGTLTLATTQYVGNLQFGTSQPASIGYDAGSGAMTYNITAGAAATSTYYNFLADGTSIVTILKGGNVGIGVTPNAWYTGNSSKALQIGVAGVGIWGYGSTTNINTYLTNNAYYDSVGWKYAQASGKASFYQQNNGLHIWSTTDTTGTAAGDVLSLTERMRITSGGDINMNATSGNKLVTVKGQTGNGYYGEVRLGNADHSAGIIGKHISAGNANLEFWTEYYSSGGYQKRMTIDYAGNIGAPTGTNIYNASDKRLKQNIVTIKNGLEAVLKLNPVKFNWLDGYVESEDGKDMLGFIAQEVQLAIPEAVEEFNNGNTINFNDLEIENPLRVNEKFIIPYLAKAIQELKAEIDQLKNK
jgi:hypothetical protein